MAKNLYFKKKILESKLKPSPYFADTFSFFFKRFLSQESVAKFFIKLAGNSSEAFEYPSNLLRTEGHLVILPQKAEDLLPYLPLLRKIILNEPGKTLLLSDAIHRDLIKGLGIHVEVLYYSTSGCRYGEAEFAKIEAELRKRQFSVCLYLDPDFFYQRLYLAKINNAKYRIGFDAESVYPLLNISLHADSKDAHIRAEALSEQYGSRG